MKTTKTIGLLSFGLLLMTFLIGLVNAQTLVAGKIYTSGYTDIVSGADVSVTCNSNVLDTTSLDDGTYAVRFEQSECGLGDDVNVNGIKGDLSGSASGVVIECNDQNDCAEGYVSIINLAIKAKQTIENTGSSGGRRYYYCGNNKCDSGETATTCPKDCKPFINQNVTTATAAQTESGTEEQNTTETQEIIPQELETQTRLSRITGSIVGVVGALGTGWIVIIIFIVGVLGLSLVVRFIRKRKTITETVQ